MLTGQNSLLPLPSGSPPGLVLTQSWFASFPCPLTCKREVGAQEREGEAEGSRAWAPHFLRWHTSLVTWEAVPRWRVSRFTLDEG